MIRDILIAVLFAWLAVAHASLADSTQWTLPTGFPQKWCHPADETRYGEIRFESDGTLIMAGELESMSPGHWTFDNDKKELRLMISWTDDWSVGTFEYYVERGDLLRFDVESRTLTYDLTATPEYLSVFGLNHFPCD